MDTQPPGSMGGTYAGNAVSCAAALAVAQTFHSERILDNVNRRGAELKRTLQLAQSKSHGKITDVRGLGLMLALECAPGKALASKIQAGCLKRDMLVLTTSIYDTLRFIPPLNISEEDMVHGCRVIGEAIEEVVVEGREGDVVETATRGQALE